MALREAAVKGVTWTFAQQFSVQIINFVVQIILARLLLPEMFGLIAMLAIFISIGQMLMDSGMTSSLIRTKNPDHLDYSTVFFTNIFISIVIYIVIFIGAPFIAVFYEQDILSALVKVYALTFVIRSFVAVHVAKLTKEMDFKTQMKLQVPSTIVGAIVGVSMAYLNYGVWSLVWLNLVQTIMFTLQTWLFVKWKPSFVFNKRRLKYHFNFGYKLTLSGLLDTIYQNIYIIVIGKAFNPVLVGYFNQAETMRKFPVAQISSVMGKVTYPLFSNINGDESLKKAYKATMRLVFFAVVPLMMALIVGGKELFIVLFGEKWLPAVPYFQVLAIISITTPLSTYNLNILKVKGRSDLFLKLEVVKKGIGLLAVFVAVNMGMKALIIAYLIVSHLSVLINMVFSGRLINYSLWEQIKDIGRIYIIGAVVMLLTYVLRRYLMTLIESELLLLVIIGFSFVLLYLLFIFIFEKRIIVLLKKVLGK